MQEDDSSSLAANSNNVRATLINKDFLKKLYFVEMRNPVLHKSFGGTGDPYGKVVEMKCSKTEKSDSQINDNERDKNTIVELVFHMIYVDNESKSESSNKDRYPIKKVSYDIFDFLVIFILFLHHNHRAIWRALLTSVEWTISRILCGLSSLTRRASSLWLTRRSTIC